jgi:hypothetical protein
MKIGVLVDMAGVAITERSELIEASVFATRSGSQVVQRVEESLFVCCARRTFLSPVIPTERNDILRDEGSAVEFRQGTASAVPNRNKRDARQSLAVLAIR